MTRLIRLVLLASLLAVGLSIPSNAQAQPYFRRWMAPYPTYTCTLNGANVDVGLSSQPVEWDVPADNAFHLIYIDNGAVVGDDGPYTIAPPLVSSQVYGAFLETVPGPYPITFDFRMDTYVSGVLVYQSTLSVACSGDATGPVTVVNAEVLPPAPPPGPEPAALPGPDMVTLPDGSVVGAFVATTPAYFAPQAGAATTTIIEAGKTMWVLGVDASGSFYKVMLSGKFFWVPVNTMGPNYDNVWQGHPLPTNVVG